MHLQAMKAWQMSFDLSGRIALACSFSNHFSPDLLLLFKLHKIWSVDFQENS